MADCKTIMLVYHHVPKITASSVGCDILLLPVHVRHVENAQTWLPTLLYTLLRRKAFKIIKIFNVTCVFYSHSRLRGTHMLLRFTKVHLIDL